MSMLRALTDDGFIAFDDLMIYEIEMEFGDRAFFPWDREYKGLKAKCFPHESHDPALFVFADDIGEIEFLQDFLQETGIKFCLHDRTQSYEEQLSDCIIIHVSNMDEDSQIKARAMLNNPLN